MVVRRHYEHLDVPMTVIQQRNDIEALIERAGARPQAFTFVSLRVERDHDRGRWVQIATRHNKKAKASFGWRAYSVAVDNADEFYYVSDAFAEEDLRHRYAGEHGIEDADVKLKSAPPIYQSHAAANCGGSRRGSRFCCSLVRRIRFACPTLRVNGPSALFVFMTALAAFGLYRDVQETRPVAVLRFLVVMLPLFGGLGYAVGHTIYASYFDAFGITPEVAGYDYKVILAQQYVYLAYVAIFGTGAVFGLYAVYSFLPKDYKSGFQRILVTSLVASIAVIAVTKKLSSDINLASDRGEQIAMGHSSTIGNTYFFQFPPTPRAVVTDLSAALRDGSPNAGSSNLLYLGQSSTTIALYDSSTRSAVLIPQTQERVAVLKADRASQTTSACRIASSAILFSHFEFTTVDVIHNPDQHLRIIAEPNEVSGQVDSPHLFSFVVNPSKLGDKVELTCSVGRETTSAGQIVRS